MKTYSTTLFPWLRANLQPGCLGALTSTDAAALRAAVEIVDLYSSCRSADVAKAYGLIVSRMQPQTQYLAFHAVAHVMDWSTRGELWIAAGLNPNLKYPRCKWEPKTPVTAEAC